MSCPHCALITRVCGVFFCMIAMLGLNLNAQSTTWPFTGPAFSNTASEIAEAAAKIVPEKFAEVTVLFEEEHNTLDAAGRVTNSHRMIYRIETTAAVESWSQASVEWEAFYQNEPTIHARVIRSDGVVAELDQKTLTDVPARDENDGTISEARLHKAPLPALNVGAIVEEETKCVDKEPLFSGGGIYRTYFQRSVPVVRSRLIVEASLLLDLKYHLDFLPNAIVKMEEVDGMRRLTVDQSHLAPSVNSDINLATHLPRYPRVEFSTGKSWASVAEAYRQLAEPQIISQQVTSLLNGDSNSAPSDRLARIQLLVSRLHKEVRYTGVEFGESKLKPQTPSEILKRHYGDCKDKATLLVAMLRAAGIRANLALLDAGPGQDVTPEFPGMNQFDHAIVYVPSASTKDQPIWIDATAEFTKVGDLPYGDQGRRALIIAEGTQELTITPQARPEDSILTETRIFQLADYGPSRVIETSATFGHFDAQYRSDYGQSDSKQLKSSLENYARNAYLSKASPTISHGDAKDFTKPFFLRLEMDTVMRGNTGTRDAAVAVYPSGTYNSLPRWFATDPDPGSQKLTEDEIADRKKAELQRSTEYDVQPFISERRYEITAPDGFALRALPPNKTAQMGPATLSQAYSITPSGIILGVIRFNSGKGIYSVEEALSLRKAILAADKEDAVMIYFDHAGAKLAAAGKVREALTSDRSVIDSHPKKPLPHVHMAYEFLSAGLGEKARTEAELATKLDPTSPQAFSTLGWALQFNAVGVHFGKGFDLNGALAAYHKAKQLDPDNTEIRENLAILFEYDEDGVRYASIPGLKNAIEEYRDLKQHDKSEGERFQDNILFDMLYAHQYKELLAESAGLPSSSNRDSLNISATAALNGLDAAIKRADGLSGDTTQRSTALRNAGAQLINLRLYSLAADVLAAGIQGQENAAGIARQIEIFRNLQPSEKLTFTASEPQSVIQLLLTDTFTNKLTESAITRLLTRHSFSTETEWQSNLRKSEAVAATMHAVAERAGLPPIVLADVTLGTMKLSAQGDDATGYRVTMQSIGSPAQHFFVTKEDREYKIVASQGDTSEVGNAALYFLHHGREAEAKSLLDWKREQLHRGGGDDPLTGPLLPRFWTAGESSGADTIELAATSLLIANARVSELLPAVVARRDKWTPNQGKPDLTDLNLLLAEGFLHASNESGARAAAKALLKEFPDSPTATRLVGGADNLKHDWAHWNAMLDKLLARHPTDRDLLAQKAYAAQAQGDFAAASKILRTVLDAGQATSNDYNSYSWNSLFEKNVDADALQAAQQANMLSKNASFADLHTLACLYAAENKTTEARQVLAQAMAAGNLGQPNSPAWFAFGAIYEQYGVTDAAIEAFKKVEKPEGIMSPTDTYVLAQAHLNALHGAH